MLHRDINPGNVLLSSSLPGLEPPRAAGFLLDLEHAYVEGSSEMRSNGEVRSFVDTPPTGVQPILSTGAMTVKTSTFLIFLWYE